MNKRVFIILFLFFTVTFIRAAYFDRLPYTITQPDGKAIKCFVSGDEFFNWIHDAEGYTIIQASDGYYYYALQNGDELKPSKYLVNTVIPSRAGLKKWAKISKAEYQRRYNAMFSYLKANKSGPVKAPQSGILNNIVVYIRFSDDAEITSTRQNYDDKFNPATGVSLKSYYKEVSYNNLTISSTHYPFCALNTNLSYQDTHLRSYFQPYNLTSNPYGYATENERTTREHTLLANAISWININSPVSSALNIDGDGDNKVDNVCFIIKGNSDGWSSLLWAHRWSLYSQFAYINGKRVYDYTFQPENQVSVGILCHEMFHSLGAPDLYHYTNQNSLSPVGTWDLMGTGSGHMSAYMKWKYTNHTWISSIPEIITSGTYTLNALTSSTNNCYKIASPYSADEYFVVEYRNKAGTYESNIPGSGLIVYRIDTRINGNQNGPPDEVYIYRPGGTISTNGNINNAYFSSTVGRTSINDTTNPSAHLQNDSIGGLKISNVTSAGSTISFTVTLPPPCSAPATQATGFSSSAVTDNSMTVGWTRGNGDYVLVIAKANNAVSAIPFPGTFYTASAVFGSGTQIGTGNYIVYNGTGSSVNISALTSGTSYHYAVYEYYDTVFCYRKPALTGNAATTGYCVAGATINQSNGEFISNVTMGSINQSSGKGSGGYQNFTSQNTTVKISVNSTITVNCTNSYMADQLLIWVDWNQDMDFADPGENVYASFGSFSNPQTVSFIPPAGANTGTTRMRIRLDDADNGPNPYPCGNGDWGEVEDYSISVIAATNTTFTADISNAWENNANWDQGIPDSTTNAVIPGSLLAIVNSNNLKCNNLTIDPLGKFTINTSKDLMIKGTFTIVSDAGGMGSFINSGTLLSTSNSIQRYIPVFSADEFHILAAPVANQAINSGFSPENQSFFAWNETNGNWIYFEDPGFNALNGNNIFTPGRGYAVSYPTSITKIFTGTINQGTISSNLSFTAGNFAGWNLVGNPFPSAINWNTASGFSRDMLEDAGAGERAFWIWNQLSGNYGTFISNSAAGTNGVSNFIASTQGFWVKAATAGLFSVNNNAREHASQSWLKATSTEINTIRLKVTTNQNSFSDEMILGFGYLNESGGAEKMFSLNASAPSLFSSKLNKKWSINNLSSVSGNDTISVGFKAGTDGIYSISATGVQSFGSVILEDLQTGQQQNLSQNAVYTFNALANDMQNRFILHLSPLGLNVIINEIPFISYCNQALTIFNPWNGRTILSIYDINGRFIQSLEIKKGRENYRFITRQGVYILKMMNDQHLFVVKEVVY